jgi:ATP-binding cassette subfamily B (MDR/TAP) protein 1
VKEELEPAPAATMWRLLKINRPEWGYGVLGSLGSIVSGCMNPAFALVISNVLYTYYDTNLQKMEHDVRTYSLIFVGLGVVAIFGYFTQHFFFGIMGENLVKRIRELMFASMLSTSLFFPLTFHIDYVQRGLFVLFYLSFGYMCFVEFCLCN